VVFFVIENFRRIFNSRNVNAFLAIEILTKISIQKCTTFLLMNILIIYYKNGENNKISEQKAEPIP